MDRYVLLSPGRLAAIQCAEWLQNDPPAMLAGHSPDGILPVGGARYTDVPLRCRRQMADAHGSCRTSHTLDRQRQAMRASLCPHLLVGTRYARTGCRGVDTVHGVPERGLGSRAYPAQEPATTSLSLSVYRRATRLSTPSMYSIYRCISSYR